MHPESTDEEVLVWDAEVRERDSGCQSGSGVMRHGSDATRGVRATVQGKREINNDETRGRGVRKWNGMKMI